MAISAKIEDHGISKKQIKKAGILSKNARFFFANGKM